jgi:hypothetical protein
MPPLICRGGDEKKSTIGQNIPKSAAPSASSSSGCEVKDDSGREVKDDSGREVKHEPNATSLSSPQLVGPRGIEVKQLSALVASRKSTVSRMVTMMFADYAKEHDDATASMYSDGIVLRNLVNEFETTYKAAATPTRLSRMNGQFALLDSKISSFTEVKGVILNTGSVERTLIREGLATMMGLTLGKTATVRTLGGGSSVKGKTCAFFMQINWRHLVYVEAIAVADADCTTFESVMVGAQDLAHWETTYGYIVSCK